MTPAEGDRLVVDLNNLKIREIADMEDATGIPFDEMFAAGKPKARAMQAVGWIVKRRDNPDFTFEEAGDLIIEVEGDVDPSQPAT